MKEPLKSGEIREYVKTVTENETASFESGEVHPFYATFALGRDAEWVCRLFVLELKDDDEEGIGTHLNITHHAPALVGDEIKFIARLDAIDKNSVLCSYEAFVGNRLIASGTTGQKILKKEKLDKIMQSLQV